MTGSNLHEAPVIAHGEVVIQINYVGKNRLRVNDRICNFY